jgi:hypothetical protein
VGLSPSEVILRVRFGGEGFLPLEEIYPPIRIWQVFFVLRT